METLVTYALIFVLALAVLAALALALGTLRLMGLRWRPIASHSLDRMEIPEAQRAVLDQATPALQGLGFVLLDSGASQAALVGAPNAWAYFDVYQHPRDPLFVMVSPSPVPNPHQPFVLQFITCFSDGSQWVTMNCFRHYSPMELPNWRVFDEYLPTWQASLQRHVARVGASGAAVSTDAAEMLRRLHQSFSDLIPQMQRVGQLKAATPGPDLCLTWRAALAFTVSALAGQWRAGHAMREQPAAAPRSTVDNESAGELQAIQAQWAMRDRPPSSARTKWMVFGLSALLFLAVGGLWMSWSFVPIVLAVVALHEGGHYLAMRLTGYRNVSVFFLPGLGGLAVGEKATATPFEKLLVYLAGPVPGIALAGLAFWASQHGAWTTPSWMQEFLIASLVINYLNLLPLVPLDGGRVVETFLFGRLPRLRFAFAVLGCVALFGLGHWLDDIVLRVVAVLIAFGLPHQWRVMQLDRATSKPAGLALGEQEALQSLWLGLQTIPHRTWSFAQRSATINALMPELMGRKARLWESVAGLTLYGIVLCAPVGLALAALPQLGLLVSMWVPSLQVPPDDVDPEPKTAPTQDPYVSPKEWEARLAQAVDRPQAERLQLLLSAAKFANDSENTELAHQHFQAAWAIAKDLPLRDLRRIETLEGLAAVVESEQERSTLLNQIIEALEVPQGNERVHVAQAQEELSYAAVDAASQVALLREAVRLRAELGPPHDSVLSRSRLMLAQALDRTSDPAGAEVQLRARVDSAGIPKPDDRTRDALHLRLQRVSSQVDWVWFLIAHERHAEAQRLVADAIANLPARITMSWVATQQQTFEAALWAQVLAPAPTDLKRSWLAYEASRKQGFGNGRTTLLHEADRAVVAQTLSDAQMQEQARRGMVEMRSKVGRRPPMCDTPQYATTAHWREAQQSARARAMQSAGACNP